ncbi:thiol-disulfide oxidoreductase [Holospora undulata HU1]|uniref:Thiol-disulfide oxidoreductase n=2 Tax=Holospora TaxID=44747 RepID=A0A061JI84_9PROT|nr:thiol-disulfide oxidoreductase [Holospora undulata HU1]
MMKKKTIKKILRSKVLCTALLFLCFQSAKSSKDSSIDFTESLEKDLSDAPEVMDSKPLKKKLFTKKPRQKVAVAHSLYEGLRFSFMENSTPLSLEKYSRKTPVLLIFWGSFCGPCLKEFPSLERLAKSMPNLKIVCVAIDGPNEITSELPLFYVNQGKGTESDNQSFLAKHSIESVPAFFLFDTTGKMLWKGIGAKEWDSASVIDKLKKFVEPFQGKLHPKRNKTNRTTKKLSSKQRVHS